MTCTRCQVGWNALVAGPTCWNCGSDEFTAPLDTKAPSQGTVPYRTPHYEPPGGEAA